MYAYLHNAYLMSKLSTPHAALMLKLAGGSAIKLGEIVISFISVRRAGARIDV